MIGRIKMRRVLKRKANRLYLILKKIVKRDWSKKLTPLLHWILCEGIRVHQSNRCYDGGDLIEVDYADWTRPLALWVNMNGHSLKMLCTNI